MHAEAISQKSHQPLKQKTQEGQLSPMQHRLCMHCCISGCLPLQEGHLRAPKPLPETLTAATRANKMQIRSTETAASVPAQLQPSSPVPLQSQRGTCLPRSLQPTKVTTANRTEQIKEGHLSLSQHYLCINCCIPDCFQCQRGSCAHRSLKLESPSAPDGLAEQQCLLASRLVAAPALRPLWVCSRQGGS